MVPMSVHKVLVTVAVEEDKVEQLRSALPPDWAFEITTPTDESKVYPSEILQQTRILFCEVPPANFEHLTQLKWIQINSVGYSQLEGFSLPEKGIRVSNPRGVLDIPIAEWCIAMIINLARDVPGMFRNQLQKIWDPDVRFQPEVRGSTLGILGYGGIGRETARLAKALGLKIWVLLKESLRRRDGFYRVSGTGDPEGLLPDRIFYPHQKSDFLSGLDFLLLSLPLTPRTRGIIGRSELEALPRSAFIINPARGPLIDELALVEALRNRRIRGAALDTHYQYPLPAEHPLWGMENVILTPHISGDTGTTHYHSRLWEVFAENVRRFVAGEPLLNEITPQELEEG